MSEITSTARNIWSDLKDRANYYRVAYDRDGDFIDCRVSVEDHFSHSAATDRVYVFTPKSRYGTLLFTGPRSVQTSMDAQDDDR